MQSIANMNENMYQDGQCCAVTNLNKYWSNYKIKCIEFRQSDHGN